MTVREVVGDARFELATPWTQTQVRYQAALITDIFFPLNYPLKAIN